MRRDGSPGATFKDREAHLIDAIQSEALRSFIGGSRTSVRSHFLNHLFMVSPYRAHIRSAHAESAPAAQTSPPDSGRKLGRILTLRCQTEHQRTYEIRDVGSPHGRFKTVHYPK